MLRYVGLRLLAVALACALCAAASPVRAGSGSVVVIRGDIVRDTNLKRKRAYLLQGLVTVRAGATLRIRAGTTVYCDVGATLVVERGAKLRAEGTADLPVVFTSQDAISCAVPPKIVTASAYAIEIPVARTWRGSDSHISAISDAEPSE